MSEIANKKIDSVDTVTVSSSVLADLFGLTERRVRQLAEEGIIVKVKRGRYDLSTSVRNYVIHLKTNNDLKEDKTKKELDIEVENALLTKAKREKVELELAAMRGDMHFSSDVERVMNDMLANFRAKLLSLPTKIAPLLINIGEVGDIQDVIRSNILEVLNELSNYDPESFYNSKHVEIVDSDSEDIVEGDAVVEEEKDTNKEKDNTSI
ncbi:hypothetical protein [Clostridium tyrobutyricum]|uniref:hypothetical protein n=1 Tax=Clostridium tyrobutyricum TaxID=1519 RepID=UPI00073D5654|nr:hypothetical protein [Clostridium tyrobutyricum]